MQNRNLILGNGIFLTHLQTLHKNYKHVTRIHSKGIINSLAWNTSITNAVRLESRLQWCCNLIGKKKLGFTWKPSFWLIGVKLIAHTFYIE